MVGTTEQRSVSVRDKLRQWHWLERRKQTLERQMQQQQERIQRLKDRLSTDGIMSSITQQTEQLDMPRPPGYGDRVGDLVAEVYARLEDAQVRFAMLSLEYEDVCERIQEIEALVATLHPRYQDVLAAFYRDRLEWPAICQRLHLSRSRLYEMREQAVEALEGALWWI